MMLCSRNHIAKLLFGKQRLYIRCHFAARVLNRLAVPNQLLDCGKLVFGALIFAVNIIKRYICNQNHLLAVVIKGDDLIKQH